MARERWTTVGIRTAYLKQLEKIAEKERRSVVGQLEKILIDAGAITPVEDDPDTCETCGEVIKGAEA